MFWSIVSWDCTTKDHQQCTFPFLLNNVSYISCTNEMGFIGKSCAIDANDYGHFKSYSPCSNNCPGGVYVKIQQLYARI